MSTHFTLNGRVCQLDDDPATPLMWALRESCDLSGDPLVQLGQLPPVDVFLRRSDRPAGGVGEDGPPTIAPAIAQALVDAGAERPLRLPLTRAGWQQEVSA